MDAIAVKVVRLLTYGNLSRDLIALYLHRVISHASAAAVGTFTVIFIYQYFDNSLYAAFLAFGTLYFGTGAIAPITARLLNYFSIRTLIITALPFIAASNFGLYLIASKQVTEYNTVLAMIISCVVTATLYRALYWVPYNTDISLLLDKTQRGTQVALLSNFADVNVAAMPFGAGIIVAFFGFSWLFLLAMALDFLSMIPLIWIKDHHEHFEWSYGETLRQLFAPSTRPLLWGYIAAGIEDGIQFVVWPLIVFILLDAQYVAFGAITALTFFSVLLIRFFTGKMFDAGKKARVLKWGAFLSASGWILKMTVATPFTIFIVDTYHGIGRVISGTAVDIVSFEQAADNGRYVDEFTVLKELAIGTGRAIALIVVAVGYSLGGIYMCFVVGLLAAAFAVLGTTWLSKRVSLA